MPGFDWPSMDEYLDIPEDEVVEEQPADEDDDYIEGEVITDPSEVNWSTTPSTDTKSEENPLLQVLILFLSFLIIFAFIWSISKFVFKVDLTEYLFGKSHN